MTMRASLRRAASAGLGAIVAVVLLTSASRAQQAYPSPEEAAASLAAGVHRQVWHARAEPGLLGVHLAVRVRSRPFGPASAPARIWRRRSPRRVLA